MMGCVFTNISCDDGDACTDDSCDPYSGCVHTHINNTDCDSSPVKVHSHNLSNTTIIEIAVPVGIVVLCLTALLALLLWKKRTHTRRGSEEDAKGKTLSTFYEESIPLSSTEEKETLHPTEASPYSGPYSSIPAFSIPTSSGLLLYENLREEKQLGKEECAYCDMFDRCGIIWSCVERILQYNSSGN
jgi:hypothetical protein